MKKNILLFILFLGFTNFKSQNREIENHVANIFQCLQKKDAECYQSFSLNEGDFTPLYQKSFGVTVYDSPLYFKSLYLNHQAQMLTSFAMAITNLNVEAGGDLNDFILKRIYITEDDAMNFWNKENSKAAMILLEKKNGKKQWVLNVSNIQIYQNKIGNGVFRDIQPLRDMTFDDLITATKAMDEFKNENAKTD